MKLTNGMKDNVCFDENENTERARETLSNPLRKEDFLLFLSGWTDGFDEDTGDVLYFFKLHDIYKLTPEVKQAFLLKISKKLDRCKI